MNYEEKRELRLQISQLLADAGINQNTLKQMVYDEVTNKVDKSLSCVLERIVKEEADELLNDALKASVKCNLSRLVKEELKNRVIQVVLKDTEAAE